MLSFFMVTSERILVGCSNMRIFKEKILEADVNRYTWTINYCEFLIRYQALGRIREKII